MGNNLTNFQDGDKVVIGIKDIDVIEQMQMTHGGWNADMAECMRGPCTLLPAVGADALIRAPSGTIFRVNPDILTKYISSDFDIGKEVTIIESEEEMQRLQIGHGGWSDGMRGLLGKSVEIVDKFPDGDYKIKFGEKMWTLNPLCFVVPKDPQINKVSVGDKVKIISQKEIVMTHQEEHGGWSELMSLLLGQEVEVVHVLDDGDCYVSKYGMNWMFSPLCFENFKQKEEDKKCCLKKGDEVLVSDNLEKCKQLQKNHGGWVSSMSVLLGKRGIVDGVFPTGDVRVTINGVAFVLNRLLLTKVDLEAPEVLSTGDSEKSDGDSDDLSTILRPQQMQLFVAVKNGDFERTKTLIDLVGPNVIIKTISLLMVAVNEGHDSLVELLLNRGASIGTKASGGDTALHHAVKLNRIEICKTLVRRGASVNEQNDIKVTPIMLAALMGCLEILQCLVAVSGADLNIGDNNKDTALHLSVQSSRLDSVEILLEAGADIKTLNVKLFSSYHMAALRGHEKILEAFLKKSGSSIVDLQKEDNFAAIHLAAMNNHTSCMKVLIKYKADLNIRNCQLQTALHIAVSQKYFECVKILVENKADQNLRDVAGDTPIHHGVLGCNLERLKKMGPLFGMSEIFKLLEIVQTGTDSCEEIVMYLAKHGAKLDIKNNMGKTAISSCEDDLLKARLMSVTVGTVPTKRCDVAPPRDTPTKDATDATQSEMDILRLRIQKLEDEKICKICCDRKIDSTFSCGHVSCGVCANNLFECHICREPIDSVIKVYR